MSSEGVLYHSKARDAAGLDVSQDQPGRAVADGEGPAAEDDPLGPAEGTDVLKVRQVGRLLVTGADSSGYLGLHGMADSNVSLHSEGGQEESRGVHGQELAVDKDRTAY